MDPIEGINLNELVKNASLSILRERSDALSHDIKKIFCKADQLSVDIKKLTSELNKKEKALDETLNKIKKLKEGDWSVLVKEKENKPEEKTNE